MRNLHISALSHLKCDVLFIFPPKTGSHFSNRPSVSGLSLPLSITIRGECEPPAVAAGDPQQGGQRSSSSPSSSSETFLSGLSAGIGRRRRELGLNPRIHLLSGRLQPLEEVEDFNQRSLLILRSSLGWPAPRGEQRGQSEAFLLATRSSGLQRNSAALYHPSPALAGHIRLHRDS